MWHPYHRDGIHRRALDPLFPILESRGFEVCLVNAHYPKHAPGRKTDVDDCQWLQYLHSVGLLTGSFRPPQAICTVRAVLRHRDSLIALGASQCRNRWIR